MDLAQSDTGLTSLSIRVQVVPMAIRLYKPHSWLGQRHSHPCTASRQATPAVMLHVPINAVKKTVRLLQYQSCAPFGLRMAMCIILITVISKIRTTIKSHTSVEESPCLIETNDWACSVLYRSQAVKWMYLSMHAWCATRTHWLISTALSVPMCNKWSKSDP